MNSSHLNSENTSVCDQVLVSLRKIIQSIDMHSRALVKRFGLTGPQLIVLREIAARSGATAGEISKAVSLGQATMTGILDRLEKRDLIKRYRNSNDRRRMQLEVTPAGERLLGDTPPLMQEAFVDAFNRIEDWEKSMILASLQRLVVMMDARQIDAAPILATGSWDTSIEASNLTSPQATCGDLDPKASIGTQA